MVERKTLSIWVRPAVLKLLDLFLEKNPEKITKARFIENAILYRILKSCKDAERESQLRKRIYVEGKTLPTLVLKR